MLEQLPLVIVLNEIALWQNSAFQAIIYLMLEQLPLVHDSLKRNSSLVKLNMSSNKITSRGAKKIAEAIQINSALLDINISKTHISIEGLLYFMQAVKNNCTLQVVNITHNNVTRSEFTSIKQYIENLQHQIQIYAAWNEICSRNGEMLIVSKLHSGNIKINV